MLNIDAVSKGYGDQVLLEETGFQINPGERVGLVGRNGHGKTTLLNMICGSEHPDSGNIAVPAGYRIGSLAQKIAFSSSRVIDEAVLGLPEHEKDQYWKAEKILAGLGFSSKDFLRDPLAFSGGFQVRLNLARVLVSEPDLLVLDEPTNYLDITSIRWITSFLQAWPREVLLVTHDRGFMDRVITHVAGIHRHKIKKIKGDTSKYYFQIQQDETVYEKTRLNEEKKRKEMEQFITRFRAKARLANMVQSRIKTLEKSQPREKLDQVKQMTFRFNHTPFSGRQVLKIENLGFGWEKHNPLFSGVSFTVLPEDRIGVIGKNGKGKTTFLKLVHGSVKPDQGEIFYNPGVSCGYFEQTNVQSLNENFTVEDELMASSPEGDRQAARNICGAMLFEKDAALKPVSVLSGGEKSRVMLGKLLMTPVNLLLLDEPSNHLDMESCDAFIQALQQFNGAVLLVTHNEMFLHQLANRLVVFKKDGVEVFDGSYKEFLDKEGWEEEDGTSVSKVRTKGSSKKEIRQKKSEIISLKSRQINPVKNKIAGIENDIEKNDVEISKITEQLSEASLQQNGEKIQSLSKELFVLEKRNEALFDVLEALTEQFESIEAEFETRLEELERDE